jgi:protein SCO1/2
MFGPKHTEKENAMKYQKLLSIFALLSGGTLATVAGLAHAEAEHQHHNHHQHHQAMAEQSGYQRSSASYSVPDIRLVNEAGAAVSLRDGLGGDGPVMLNFIFTSCTSICPVMSATFRQVQEKLGAESGKVRMVSISIDPENDTPQKLKEYAARYQAGPQWRMFTGSIGDSIAVQRAFDAYRGDKMNHTPVTFLRAGGADSTWVRLDGLASAADIVNEYRKLEAR